MSERTICIVQARLGSRRLPGKCLRALSGRPLIAHVLERVAKLPVDGVVLATTTNDHDDLLAAEALAQGVAVMRGPDQDVLDRVSLAAAATRATVIVRVTGDCPLFATDVGTRVIETFHAQRRHAPIDYCWNDTLHSGFPDGTDIEVFTASALRQANRNARDVMDREHVTPWIRRRLVTMTVMSPDNFSALKLSVDSADDFARVSSIMASLPPGALALADTLTAARKAGVLT